MSTTFVLEREVEDLGSALPIAGVERSHKEWITADEGHLHWTNDFTLALRLARREDADQLAQIVEDCWHIREYEDDQLVDYHARMIMAEAEVKRLHGLIHTPQTTLFLEALPLEAAFQIDNWGNDHDKGKQPEDFFWLLGWLAGKVVHSAKMGDIEKAKHHTISSAASLLNWHRRLSGEDFAFQPGSDAVESDQ